MMGNHSEPQADATANGASNTIQAYMEAYVTELKQAGVIDSEAVEQAFRTVPRHRLVRTFYVPGQGGNYTQVEYDPDSPDPTQLEIIYSGTALVTRFKDGLPASSSSESGLVAHMLELLHLDRGMSVLEIGAGTGYNAALMAEIVGDQSQVTTVDNQPDVVAQAQELLAGVGYSGIRVRCADGFYGFAETAPYDRVIVTVGSPDLSPHWVEQLKPSGFILLPLRHAGANPLVRVSQRGDAITGQVVGMSGFMAMYGQLWDETYYGASIQAADQPTIQLPVWSDLHKARGTKVEWWKSRRAGFWFYLGIKDQRTQFTRWLTDFGLIDPQTNSSAILDGEQIMLVGDRTLLDRLEALHDEWLRLGSPCIQDYSIKFVPPDAMGVDTSKNNGLGVLGKCYARVFTLE